VRYVKEVDADEETISFFQEIYADKGKLKEVQIIQAVHEVMGSGMRGRK